MKRNLKRSVLMIIGCLLPVAAAVVSGHPMHPAKSDETQFETRCGWFVNPTPANIWLYDKDGEWTIGVQGGYQIEDEWEWPAFKPRQWVKTNGNYGYGCTCLQVRVNREAHNVVEIRSSRARPLSACRRDRSLFKWKQKLE